MSDIEDYYEEMDEDYLEELLEDQDAPSPEEVFNMVSIDKKRGLKTTATLMDEDEEEVPLGDVIEDLTKYIRDQLIDERGEGNQFADQIMPLMSQSMASGLSRLIGIPSTAFIVGSDHLRMSMIHMMCVGFLLLKFVQKNNLTIHTIEEEISQEEIESMVRRSKATSAAQMGAMLGVHPKDVLKQLVQDGKITEEDFSEIFRQDGDTDENNPEDGDPPN